MKIVTNLKKMAKLNDAIKAADVSVYYINYYIDSDKDMKVHTVSVVDNSPRKAIEKVRISVLDKTGQDIVVKDISCL